MEGANWLEIRADRLKGLNCTELGKRYHIDPRTAKRYAESPRRPAYTLSAPKPTKLDAYKRQLDQWLEEAPYSAVRILEKRKEQGFEGKDSIVKEYVRSRNMDLAEQATARFETGDSLRIIRCRKTGNGRSCTVSCWYWATPG